MKTFSTLKQVFSCKSQLLTQLTINKTRPAWAGFKTAEEGRTKIM